LTSNTFQLSSPLSCVLVVLKLLTLLWRNWTFGLFLNFFFRILLGPVHVGKTVEPYSSLFSRTLLSSTNISKAFKIVHILQKIRVYLILLQSTIPCENGVLANTGDIGL